MQWGLGMICGACAAIVLGMAVVAPSASRGAGPAATPSEAILAGGNPRPGASTMRVLVPVPVPVPVPEKPEEGQPLPPTPDPEETPEATGQGPVTASETSTARD